ncbi:MAG: hypothetical protein GYA23_00640 [Methanomicrobiales archaeon]|nr:hypothetical protein [Methanomicrobiales archaeon]
MPVPTPAPSPVAGGNYSKLELNPSYYLFGLKPGETKEVIVTVRNRDSKPVAVHPAFRPAPFAGPFELDRSWISISPTDAEVPAGGSAKFTVRATAPADAQRGTYNSQIVFTDEQYPSPYPAPYPNYVHQMSIGANILTPPVVKISPSMISDQIEAGKEYRYVVEITNSGTSPLVLNPKAESENYPVYGPSGPMEPALTAGAFSLNAPTTLQPGSTGTLNINLNTPATAGGYYNGYIDLGIDDASLMQGEGRIMTNFNIWKQPPEPFVRKFTMDKEEPLAVEISSGVSWFGSGMPADVLRDMPVREPSFDTTLTGPDGAVALTPVKKIIKGNVNLGGDMLPFDSGKAGTYQETNVQYVVTYTAEGEPGNWQLQVMPRNSQSFEYTITLGGKEEAGANSSGPEKIPVVNQTSVPAITAVNETASP